MMLSVCLITRDEEATIARALRSVAPVAGQVVVVDTGSADHTREVAAAEGATVLDFPWCDDFSAARNFALPHLTGDWVMVLDADEELLPGSVTELRRCLARADALGYTLLRENLSDPARPDVFTENRVLRILRRLPDVRFVGRIHERLAPTPEELVRREGKAILHSGVRLRHTGYVADLRVAKLRRSAHLLKLELADRPKQFDALVEYGRTLLQLNDPAGHGVLGQALRHLHDRRHDRRPPHPLAAALLEYVLTTPNDLIEGPVFASDAALLTQAWFPNSPPLLWVLAQQHFAAGRFADAARALEHLLTLAQTRSYDTTVPFDPRILGPDAALNLGGCYFRMGDLARAERQFRALLAHPSHRAAAESNLSLIAAVRQGRKT